MSLFWKIYLVGYVVALIQCVAIVRDEDNKISWVELIVSMFVSLLSWLIALAFFVSHNIKHGHDNEKKNPGDKDNLEGT